MILVAWNLGAMLFVSKFHVFHCIIAGNPFVVSIYDRRFVQKKFSARALIRQTLCFPTRFWRLVSIRYARESQFAFWEKRIQNDVIFESLLFSGTLRLCLPPLTPFAGSLTWPFIGHIALFKNCLLRASQKRIVLCLRPTLKNTDPMRNEIILRREKSRENAQLCTILEYVSRTSPLIPSPLPRRLVAKMSFIGHGSS